jgi:hypothetical protein
MRLAARALAPLVALGPASPAFGAPGPSIEAGAPDLEPEPAPPSEPADAAAPGPSADELTADAATPEPSADASAGDESDELAIADDPRERLAPDERRDASGGAPVAGRASGAPEAPLADVPDRMRPMQAAGWWTLFGAFALGTGAGVFAGLATRQQDRALRLGTVFEPGTGRQPLWTDARAEYEAILRRGRAYQGTAVALGVVAGAAAVAAVVLFVVDDRRRKRVEPAVAVHPTGLQVRF